MNRGNSRLLRPLPPAGEGFRRSRLANTLSLILAFTLLAACGKKGSPVAPGPSNEIVYPRAYPSR